MDMSHFTQFAAPGRFGGVLAFDGLPSYGPSTTTFYVEREIGSDEWTAYSAKVSMTNNELQLTSPDAVVAGKLEFIGEDVKLGDIVYTRQKTPCVIEATLLDSSSSPDYSTYECEHLIKGTGDGLIAYVIAPKHGSYDDFVVFAGTDERLYALKQYARFVRHRSEGDIAYVTFDATFLDKANLTYPAGDYTIKPDDGTWETLTLADYVITFEGDVATIKRKV